MKTKQQHWAKTVAAAKAEESSAWSMIWAMAEEAFDRDPTYKNISSGPVIEEIRLELEAAGITLAFKSIKSRAVVGKMVHGAVKADSEILRSVPWSVVLKAYEVGASAEAMAAHVRACRQDGVSPTAVTVTEAFGPRSGTGGSPSSEESSRKFSDDRYMAAIATIAMHTMAERRGEYTPSPMARLAGSLLGEMLVGKVAVVDWDAQLNDLIKAEGGA